MDRRKRKKTEREMAQKASTLGLRWAERWVKRATADKTSWDYFNKDVEEDSFNSLLEILSGNSENEMAENLNLKKLEGKLPPVRIPFPQGHPQLPVWRLPLAAAIGVFFGLLIFGPLLRLAGIHQQEIVLVTGMGGAFLTTWGISHLVRSPKGRNIMLVIAGIGGVAAAAKKIMGLIPGWGGFWRIISGRKASKAFLLFPLAALLALISRPKLVYPDNKEVAKIIETSVFAWMEAILYLGTTQEVMQEDLEKDSGIKVPEEVIKAVYRVHQAPVVELETACEELIQEVKKVGFEGFDGKPSFLESTEEVNKEKIIKWSGDLKEKYDTFGEVQEGDRVRIEEPAIIFKGGLVKKGMVRKITGGRRQ